MVAEATTYETARKCPRCGFYGEETSAVPGRRASTIHTFMCRTNNCRWENTSWIVQVKNDGSIPIRNEGDKEFPAMTKFQERIAQAEIDRLTEG